MHAFATSDQIILHFDSFNSCVQFRLAAYGGLSSGGRYVHDHELSDPTIDHYWIEIAKQFLQEYGVPYSIEHPPGTCRFVFSNPYAHAVFAELALGGMLREAAIATHYEAQGRVGIRLNLD